MMIVTSFIRKRNITNNQKRQILINQNPEIAINYRNIKGKKASEHNDDVNEDILEKKINTTAHELEDNAIISSKGFRKIQKNKITVGLEKSPDSFLEEESSYQVILPNIHKYKLVKNDKKRSSTFTKSLELKQNKLRDNSIIRSDSKQISLKKPNMIHKLNYLNYIPHIDYSLKPNKTCYNVLIVI